MDVLNTRSQGLINMEMQTADNQKDMKLIREYVIFHKEAPERKVNFRTLRTMTAKQVKEKMVSAGLFHVSVIQELRVERR